MFNIFKKRIEDETLEEQRQDILKFNPMGAKIGELGLEGPLGQFATFQDSMLNGLSCDQLPHATGKFGFEATNPIPVNGPLGEIKYLNRLRNKNGVGIIYHRLGSFGVKAIQTSVDAYEVVSIHGDIWDVLYFDMHHPRRSTLPPEGYTFCKFHPIYSKLGFGYGSNSFDDEFPFGIPQILARKASFEEKMGKTLKQEFLDQYSFKRPAEHLKKTQEHRFLGLQFQNCRKNLFQTALSQSLRNV